MLLYQCTLYYYITIYLYLYYVPPTISNRCRFIGFNKTIFCQSTQPPVSYHPNHVWLHRGDLSCCWSAAPQLWISPLSPTATSVHEPRCPRFVSGQQHLLFVDAHLNTHWAAVHVLYYLTSGLIGFCLKHHITTICCWITSILRICFCQQVQGEQYSYSSSAF